MTGFGAAEGRLAAGAVRVEIRSVNHRYLSVALKAPPEIAPFESEVRERLRRDFERGHLTVSVRWLEAGPARSGPTLRLDVDRAREAMARLRELKTAVGLNGEITLELVARQPDVFTTVEPDGAPVEWPGLESILGRAAAECRAMRDREGRVLAEELEGRLALLRALRAEVAARAPARLGRERDRLRAQVGELLDGRAVDEGRLAQELAFLADRLDVTEELVRLGAHLDACCAALAGDRAVGKQLGFLAQEMGREVNTIGAKANDAVMQHAVVEMKGELERFREQLENLE
jgi:uncharacterized protein (TIGR00255 family)